MSTRKSSHAGSWYVSDRSALDGQLTEWLTQAKQSMSPARAIIAPHAGYSYCGACGAWAYKQVIPDSIKRVFILGPSHHLPISDKCALSDAKYFESPLYNLSLDEDVQRELLDTKEFITISLKNDENEHSVEMHIPYVAKVMETRKDKFTIIPIVVGSLSPEREGRYGEIFARYLSDPQNLFVISSDFCHWGPRFRYTYYDSQHGSIWQSIENLDKAGMDIIENLDPMQFKRYLNEYKNTICGRHPIGVLLYAIQHMCQQPGFSGKPTLRFLQYAQSERCMNNRDNSVSYASAALVIS